VEAIPCHSTVSTHTHTTSKGAGKIVWSGGSGSAIDIVRVLLLFILSPLRAATPNKSMHPTRDTTALIYL